MKLQPWIHSWLHIGCVALLLIQGHRNELLRRAFIEQCERESDLKSQIAELKQLLFMEEAAQSSVHVH
jgi:hypothetical protein